MSDQGKGEMAESPARFTNEWAVVYLARFAEGPAPVAAFIASYQRYRTGAAHDVVVIRKGFPNRKTAQDGIIGQFSPNTISISDQGFDVSAYARAAAQLPHKYVVFLNTFSEIASEDWLKKLRSALSDPTVGIAGATGSYESLRDSMKRVNSGWWQVQPQNFINPVGVRQVFRATMKFLPKRLVQRVKTRIISYLAAKTANPNGDHRPDAAFELFWDRETKAGGAYEFLSQIPPFPNAHIRTNAFAIERQLFLETLPSSIATKADSYLYENGPDSLTRKILLRGQKAIVVGHDGQSYDIDQWSKSGTFRLGSQHNLLVKDNQTRAYDAMSTASKHAYAVMTWGDDQHPSEP